jgi:hypothetical protein
MSWVTCEWKSEPGLQWLGMLAMDEVDQVRGASQEIARQPWPGNRDLDGNRVQSQLMHVGELGSLSQIPAAPVTTRAKGGASYWPAAET